MAKSTSVLWSADQGLEEEEKAQARNNIDAGQTNVKKITGGGGSSTETTFKNVVMYSDGRILCDGEQIVVAAPVPDNTVKGKALVADVDGAGDGIADWKDIVLDNIKFANVLGKPDNSNATVDAYLDKINTPITTSYYKLHIKNEQNSQQEFILIPANAEGGFLFKLDEGPIITKDVSENIKKPCIRSNVAFSGPTTSGDIKTWTLGPITCPEAWNGQSSAFLQYTIYVSGADFGKSATIDTDTWDVQINGSNWTTGIRGNFSTFMCTINNNTGVTFTVKTPKSVTHCRACYIIYPYSV